MKLVTVGLAVLLASPMALAAYENQFCYSGDKQTISYLENVTAGTMQFSGSWRSTPPGGVLDGATSECVGSFSVQYGKYTSTGNCKTISDDESAYFSEYFRSGKNGKEKILNATGKFVPRVNVPTAFTAFGSYPQLPGKIVGCVSSNSRD